MVGQDLREQIRVGLQLLDRGGIDLGERIVCGREDRELAAVERVDEVDLRVELPEIALVSVVSIGLLDAATATGSIAIPATEPGPVGTFSAYAVHDGPTSSADAGRPAVVRDRPMAAAAARPATATVRLVFFIEFHSLVADGFYCRLFISGFHLVFGCRITDGLVWIRIVSRR